MSHDGAAADVTGNRGRAHVAKGLDNARDQQLFIERLTETISWCTNSGSLANPRGSLRTIEPSYLISPEFQVSGVGTSRHLRLRSAKLTPVTDLRGGRLAAYFPNDNLSDGVAMVESHGFLDVDNAPPSDTWVWWVQNVEKFTRADGTPGERDANYLVAWVPQNFILLANAGIDVNPEQCVLWLDTLDDDFVRSLCKLNLV
jgi:hypothetical protein